MSKLTAAQKAQRDVKYLSQKRQVLVDQLNSIDAQLKEAQQRCPHPRIQNGACAYCLVVVESRG